MVFLKKKIEKIIDGNQNLSLREQVEVRLAAITLGALRGALTSDSF